MARKKKPEEHENHERWLVSYADFITLLFAFFVVMYSISSVNEGKYRVLSDALISAFRQPQRSIKPIQVGEPAKSPVTSNVEFMNEPTKIETPVMIVPQKKPLGEEEQEGGKDSGAGAGATSIDKIAESVSAAMADLVEQGLVSVNKNDLWVEVEIRDSVLFPSASARLHTSAVPVLREIASIMAEFPNPVRVEGFTDDLPINTLLYPSNWELSTARAASVVRLFEHFGLHPQRMSALGYGEHRPVASNDTAVGRAKNRRVVVVVLADRRVEQLLESRMQSGAEATPVSAGGREAERPEPPLAGDAGGASAAARLAGDVEPRPDGGVRDGAANGQAAGRDPVPAAPATPLVVSPERLLFPVIETPVKFAPPVRVPRLRSGEPRREGPAPFTLSQPHPQVREGAEVTGPGAGDSAAPSMPPPRAPSRPRPPDGAADAAPGSAVTLPQAVIQPPVRFAPPVTLPDMTPGGGSSGTEAGER